MEYIANNLEIVNNPSEIAIWDKLIPVVDDLTGIMGYKTPSLGERDFNSIPSFIFRGKDVGIILIDIVDEKIVEFDGENEYWKTTKGDFIYSKDLMLNLFSQELENKLKKAKELYDIRKSEWTFKFAITKLIVFPYNTEEEIKKLLSKDAPLINPYATSSNMDEVLKEILTSKKGSIEDAKADIIDSLFDGSDVFHKTRKKKVVDDPETVNDFIKKSLNNTFKLDHIQRQIALQIPLGPQRIRGLAGTGKTVILCMKAALAHKTSPKAKVLFVFNTQSMYNQIKNTITEYYFNEAKTMPNWDNLHILHAWGGASKEGLYHKTAITTGVKPLNFMNVRNRENPLEAIYNDLLSQAKAKIVPEYDIVLIDEAQDFTPSFFETVFLLTKVDPVSKLKKIIWAYDEFQSLTELKIKQPEELFGKNADGAPNMKNEILEGKYKGNIKKDFVLPNSYRNPRINLMVAHGLALGVYSKHGKIPMEKREDWEARGYKIHEPKKDTFTEGDKLKVERLEAFSKNNLELLLKESKQDEKKLVQFIACNNVTEELKDIVGKIEWLIKKQNVEPEEVVVVNLDTYNSKSHFMFIRQQLDMMGIKSIMPGYIESPDAFKEPGYVTLTTTFKSKGNEANIVFILNAHKVITDSTFRLRNAIFVAITRSRGWCYISGHGESIKDLQLEISEIIRDYPFFNFIFPSEDQIKRRLTIIQSQKDLEKVDTEIEKMFSEEASRALLLEKLMKNPDLLKEIEKRNKKEKGDDK